VLSDGSGRNQGDHESLSLAGGGGELVMR